MQREQVVEESRSEKPSAARGVLVILGASGDLTKRLLVPALYNLACDGLLADDFAVVGMARRPLSTATVRATTGCDLLFLPSCSFRRILRDFPAAEAEFRRIAADRYRAR